MMPNRDRGKLLAQIRPANTTAASAYSPGSGVQANITQVWIANNTGSAVAARLFLDHDGTTYDQSTALYYDKSIAANDTVVTDTDIWMTDSAGNLAGRTATGDALTFTVFGVEYTV